jgi:carbonic anhydrase
LPTNPPHFAKNVFFGCIDDRIVETHLNFIIKIGGAFYPAVAGGGFAFVDLGERETALKQVAAAYSINHVTTIYIESHTDCGAYRLAGIQFTSAADEIDHLYQDLDTASDLVKHELETAGAGPGEVTILTRVIDPSGTLIPRPTPANAKV